jgi:hypothetical protein
MRDRLGEAVGVVAKDTLSQGLDKLVPHNAALFAFRPRRWHDLFGLTYGLRRYDLTSTDLRARPALPRGRPPAVRLQPGSPVEWRPGRLPIHYDARRVPAGLRGPAGEHSGQDDPPHLARIRPIIWRTCISPVTSTSNASARPPVSPAIVRATSSAPETRISATTRSAPSSANRLQMATPNPCAPPVTTATRSWS